MPVTPLSHLAPSKPADAAGEALAARLAVIRWDERIACIRRRQAEIAAANRPFARERRL